MPALITAGLYQKRTPPTASNHAFFSSRYWLRGRPVAWVGLMQLRDSQGDTIRGGSCLRGGIAARPRKDSLCKMLALEDPSLGARTGHRIRPAGPSGHPTRRFFSQLHSIPELGALEEDTVLIGIIGEALWITVGPT